MASSKKNTPPKVGRKKDEGNAGSAADEAQEVIDEVKVEIVEFERLLGQQIERVQLSIASDDKDVLA